MFGEIFLSVLSPFLTQGGDQFYQEQKTLPAGEYQIHFDHPWNGLALTSLEGAVPQIDYRLKPEDAFVTWEKDEHAQGALQMIFFSKDQRDITLRLERPLRAQLSLIDTRDDEGLLAFDSIEDLFLGLEISTPPRFYTRSEWGADETIRYKGILGKLLGKIFSQSAPEAKKLPKADRPTLLRSQEDGKALIWPIEQNKTLKKIVIHHTAEAVNEKRTPFSLMRAIYYYHTRVREWGDIGYNYVIDKEGNIYEGRAGGELAVGAHTAFHNVDSLGIALMGNFENEKPTKKQQRSLEILLADVAYRYQIDLKGKSEFLDENSYNVSGHGDIAVEGHGTACPGDHLRELLPEIRKNAKNFLIAMREKPKVTTRDRLSKSKEAPEIRGFIERPEEDLPEISLGELLTPFVIRRGESKSLQVKVKNGTKQTWPSGVLLKVFNVPDGVILESFTSVEDVLPGDSGTFTAQISVKDTPNGLYSLELKEYLAGVKEQAPMVFPLQISGDSQSLFQSFQTSLIKQKVSGIGKKPAMRESVIEKKNSSKSLAIEADSKEYGPLVKIKISRFANSFLDILSPQTIRVFDLENKPVFDIEPQTPIRVVRESSELKLVVGNETRLLKGAHFKTLKQDGIITLKNYNSGISQALPYNQFRRQISVYPPEGLEAPLLVVNQLPLEQYLWGLAEEPKAEPLEKKNAIFTLARSYAYVYSGSKRKFKTSLYDLEDSPATSQFYLGYDWERYHYEQRSIVEKTHGIMLTYEDHPVIGPYFTQSAGKSLDTWKKEYPWTRSQVLPYDNGLVQKGHGVGLSGNSARVLAEKGKNYEEILDYFFEGTSLKKIY